MHTNFICAGDLSKAKILIIGHDPRLQKSDTLAGNTFFADYFFRAIPTQGSERSKYMLAEAVYSYISFLTSYKYPADQIVLTNLCNESLPHAPKGKIVYISEDNARQGVSSIEAILDQSDIKIIFAMSAQVNYWLQKLEFYQPVEEYLRIAKPKAKGIFNSPPYYEQTRGRAFVLICGNQYLTKDQRSVFPILHVKNWPMNAAFNKAYRKSYESCINALK